MLSSIGATQFYIALLGCTTNLTNGEFCLETIQSEEALQIYNILKDRMLSGRWSIKSYKEN